MNRNIVDKICVSMIVLQTILSVSTIVVMIVRGDFLPLLLIGLILAPIACIRLRTELESTLGGTQ